MKKGTEKGKELFSLLPSLLPQFLSLPNHLIPHIQSLPQSSPIFFLEEILSEIYFVLEWLFKF